VCAPCVCATQVIKKRLPLSVETCAHYLTFSAEQIPDGDTKFKCAPPLRDEDNRKALLAAVKSGDIDIISSDHSPAPPGMKETDSGNFLKAWGGISGNVLIAKRDLRAHPTQTALCCTCSAA